MFADAAAVVATAEKTAEATSCLETQLQHTPAESELRALLDDRYRVAGKWSNLADFLTEGVEFATDDEQRVAMLREASEVLVRKLNAPERAIPVLEPVP